MIHYSIAHWRGAHTLVRSYWVNGVLVTLGILFAATISRPLLESLEVATSVYLVFALSAVLIAINIWQFVGIWRSASNTTRTTNAKFWPIVAKIVITVGTLNGAFKLFTTVRDLFAVLSAVQTPALADYQLQEIADGELYLTGAINDRSVDETMEKLRASSISYLWINSHGGLTAPAIRLAHYIRDNQTTVVADGQCDSSCAIIFAASPRGIISPGTRIGFHEAESIVEFDTPELRAENERYLDAVSNYYKEVGMPDWFVTKLAQEEFWTPTLIQLIELGLVDQIYLPEIGEIVEVRAYCDEQPDECAR